MRSSAIRIVSWNINGIRSAHRKGFLDWLGSEKADIICLQETKIDEAALPAEMRSPLGRNTEWAFAKKKGYSGVATFARSKLVSSRAGIGIAQFDDEGRVVETEHADFLVFNVYFPKGSGTLRDNSRVPYKLAFYDAVFKHIKKRERSAKKPAIVLGDFNTAHEPIDLKNPKTNTKNSGYLPAEREAFSRHLKGFVDTFRYCYPDRVQYTWWTTRFDGRARNVGWRIDYVWLSEALLPRLKDAFVDDHVHGSDHCPVGIELKARR